MKVEPGAGQQMVAAGEEYQDSYQEFPEEYGEEGGEGSQYYTDTDAAGVAGTSQLVTARTWELGTAFIDLHPLTIRRVKKRRLVRYGK